MNKRRLFGTGTALFCGLLVLTGCSFFDNDEPAYNYWEPVLSPDGTALVYESTVESGLELFLLDLGTDMEQQLTDNDYPDWSPNWSPDGTQLAFASSRDENVDIYVLDVDTLNVLRLTTHVSDDVNPSWGIDGDIYFNSNRGDSWEAYAIDPVTFNLRKLSSRSTSTP